MTDAPLHPPSKVGGINSSSRQLDPANKTRPPKSICGCVIGVLRWPRVSSRGRWVGEGAFATGFSIIHLFAAEGIRGACQSSFGPAALAPKLRSVTAHTLCRRRPLFQCGNTREKPPSLLHLSFFFGYATLWAPSCENRCDFPSTAFKPREMYSQLIKRFGGISRVLFPFFLSSGSDKTVKIQPDNRFELSRTPPTPPEKNICQEDENL